MFWTERFKHSIEECDHKEEHAKLIREAQERTVGQRDLVVNGTDATTARNRMPVTVSRPGLLLGSLLLLSLSAAPAAQAQQATPNDNPAANWDDLVASRKDKPNNTDSKPLMGPLKDDSEQPSPSDLPAARQRLQSARGEVSNAAERVRICLAGCKPEEFDAAVAALDEQYRLAFGAAYQAVDLEEANLLSEINSAESEISIFSRDFEKFDVEEAKQRDSVDSLVREVADVSGQLDALLKSNLDPREKARRFDALEANLRGLRQILAAHQAVLGAVRTRRGEFEPTKEAADRYLGSLQLTLRNIRTQRQTLDLERTVAKLEISKYKVQFHSDHKVTGPPAPGQYTVLLGPSTTTATQSTGPETPTPEAAAEASQRMARIAECRRRGGDLLDCSAKYTKSPSGGGQ